MRSSGRKWFRCCSAYMKTSLQPSFHMRITGSPTFKHLIFVFATLFSIYAILTRELTSIRRKKVRKSKRVHHVLKNRCQSIANCLQRHSYRCFLAIALRLQLRCKSSQTRHKDGKINFYLYDLIVIIGDSLGINVKDVSTYANCLRSSHSRKQYATLFRAYGN